MTTWVLARRARNFKQEWAMLQRRLDYPGGRKARSAERRIRKLVGPMHVLLRGMQADTRTVTTLLLAGVGAAVPVRSGGDRE